jgi:hypothetical protein
MIAGFYKMETVRFNMSVGSSVGNERKQTLSFVAFCSSHYSVMPVHVLCAVRAHVVSVVSLDTPNSSCTPTCTNYVWRTARLGMLTSATNPAVAIALIQVLCDLQTEMRWSAIL